MVRAEAGRTSNAIYLQKFLGVLSMLVFTKHPFMACMWLRESCRQIEAEVVSNSRKLRYYVHAITVVIFFFTMDITSLSSVNLLCAFIVCSFVHLFAQVAGMSNVNQSQECKVHPPHAYYLTSLSINQSMCISQPSVMICKFLLR